ncbi:transposase [Candidatus Neptunochlamydia vexilliferae]|uniref:N-acetyltransferase domain-containing protein n=1 Tax=Candidatus Neptunichlamydia vexilliferae TaxID=1651774 RepID=A0ABS0B3A3_9BACT|nr:transposase [Candidatus Neptunochlamydia vexilliferae]MBF5060070.1 hypothetical protein [Candidatus Neptunochlamydia vexilliferae]
MTRLLDCPKEHFLKVSKELPSFKRVKHYFKTLIQAIYGNQDKAIKKIAAGKDRACELFESEEGHDVGLIVFKTHLTKEFSPLGFEDSFEIKTLFVIDPKKNAGKKIATHLLNRLAKHATELKAKNVFVSVSTIKPESLAFFLNHGFRTKKIKKNAYITGSNEYYLFHNSPEKLLARTTLVLLAPKKQFSKLYLDEESHPQLEFSTIEWKALSLYLAGKNLNMVINGLEDYFGTTASTSMVHKVLSKLKQSNLKWHAPKLVSTYTIIFINTLYRDEDKTEAIGELIIGLTPSGKRHVLGCTPPGPLPQSYWIGIFSELKARGLKKVDIISFQKHQHLPLSLNKFYKNMKIINTDSLKAWFIDNLSPQNIGQQLLEEALEIQANTILIEEQAEIRA